MKGMVTRLNFGSVEAANEELAELERQADSIAQIEGFRALHGIRVGLTEVMIVRVFDSAQGVGRSLAGPLRPDLAAEFAEAPFGSAGRSSSAARRSGRRRHSSG